MYSLVALGFVLIYKASGVFNFAQGAMVLFAALTFVGAAPSTGCRSGVALADHARGDGRRSASLIERLVLRPLVNQPQITLFMATIGLDLLPRGPRAAACGARNVHGLDLGIQDEPIAVALRHDAASTSSKFDLVAAGIAARAGRGAGAVLQRTRIGRALRAVADDHQAALAVGIPLQQIWVIVWASPASSRWWPACCGARATACSSR